MRREISVARALALSFLVAAALGLAAVGVMQVNRRDWRWQPTFSARADFPTIAGVAVGDRVRVQGIDAGVVEAIVAPSGPGGLVGLKLRLDQNLKALIRADAIARIVSTGVVGGKVVELLPGLPDAPALVDGSTLKAEAPRELADLVADASKTLARVDAAARAAETGLAEVNAIAATIRRGEGTLGKLVKDDEAYRALLGLGSRGQQALGALDENLAALKHTWPISRYFNRRGFDDRDTLLFQPGSDRESRTLVADDLFEPGRAVLTAPGRQQLDAIGGWFRHPKRPKTTEVVIAAFTDAPRGPEVARLLSQQQADAVRQYLVKQYKIDSAGWWRSRKVAAVGFGDEVPLAEAAGVPQGPQPARRVEVILFTPQT